MDNNYKNIIWTNHSLQRMRERGIKQSTAWAIWKNPQSSNYSGKKGTWIYRSTVEGKIIEVVAKKNEAGKWIVLSVWSKFGKKSKQENKKTPLLFRFLKKFWG